MYPLKVCKFKNKAINIPKNIADCQEGDIFLSMTLNPEVIKKIINKILRQSEKKTFAKYMKTKGYYL